MGVFVERENDPYSELRDLALSKNADDIDELLIDEDEPYKVLIEFYVSKMPASLFCAIDGTANLYLGTGTGFINGVIENETIKKISKSIVFEAKNVVEIMETVFEYPAVSEGYINIYVVTQRNIYGINVSQSDASDKKTEMWKIYYLAIEIISMYMNS